MKRSENSRNFYKPFDYSKLKTYVVEVIISDAGVTKIEARIPPYVKNLKAIYVSSRINSETRVLGDISLNFNNGITKNFHVVVLNTKKIKHSSHPMPLDTELKPGSTIMGFFLDRQGSVFPYNIKIYLHYSE